MILRKDHFLRPKKSILIMWSSRIIIKEMSYNDLCKVWKSVFFLITPIVWNFKNLYQSLHKLSMVSVSMCIYLYIFAYFGQIFKCMHILQNFFIRPYFFSFFRFFLVLTQIFREFQKRIFKNLVQMHILIMQSVELSFFELANE